LTAAIAHYLVSVRYAALVNLLADREVVPEHIQQTSTPDRLAATLIDLLNNPAAAATQRAAFATIVDQLRPPRGLPSEAAADAVLELLDQHRCAPYVQHGPEQEPPP